MIIIISSKTTRRLIEVGTSDLSLGDLALVLVGSGVAALALQELLAARVHVELGDDNVAGLNADGDVHTYEKQVGPNGK